MWLLLIVKLKKKRTQVKSIAVNLRSELVLVAGLEPARYLYRGILRYLRVDFQENFTKEEKFGLYRKLYTALKDGGSFILTDYFADLPEQEEYFRGELLRLKAEQGLSNEEFYHYDTPLTFEHEMDALREAGFREVTDLKRWEATHCIRVVK